ncbi:tetratricopeptide repeat protein [Arenicella xantha]|nr:hypothetical protein [Arenicella xantha]
MLGRQTLKSLGLLGSIASLLIVSGCTSIPKAQPQQAWMQDVINYQFTLGADHQDSIERLYQVTPEMRATVVKRFGHLPGSRAVRKMAMWLVDEQGKKMDYDVNANFRPIETFYRNRGNCLSFTLLLVQLAHELDIDLKINEVDLPNMWGENQESGLVFYRHVNAIHKSDRYTQVFDLALEEYGPGYPQRYISKREAAALLFSNIGIQRMLAEDYQVAQHYLKLAVSLSQENSDMWINLAAGYRRSGNDYLAEKSYLHAQKLNDKDSLAASNLERLYRSQGRALLADRYKKLAHRARQKNPYLHFHKAQTAFKSKHFADAKRAIKRAIKLYDRDPQFYELSSRIHQVENDYVTAIKNLETAHNISQSAAERGRYASKVDLVIARAKQQAANNQASRANKNADAMLLQRKLRELF